MSGTSPTPELLERWRTGDREAATKIHRRYAQRLWEIANRQIGRRLQARVDADEILVSAFDTFFRRTARGEYPLNESCSIWQLLVRITLNKVRRKAEYHRCGKRDVDAEVPGGDEYVELAARGPSVEHSVMLQDEMTQVLSGMSSQATRVVRLSLEGFSPSEVAASLGTTRWTVQRVLRRVGHRLETRMDEIS